MSTVLEPATLTPAASRDTRGAPGAARTAAPSGGRGGAQADGQKRPDGLADFLGWFSIGLGAAQILAPDRVYELIGLNPEGRSRLGMRALGVREMTAGIGILTNSKPTGWLWARVAGDLMDLGLLGNALLSGPEHEERTIAATAAVLGIAALDAYAGEEMGRASAAAGGEAGGIHVKKYITIWRPVEEVYGFWRDFRNLPRFMRHLQSVEMLGGGRSHWKTRAPGGTSVEWDAETIADVPNQRIAWRSLEGSEVGSTGEVRFNPGPGGQGTEVRVDLRYDPPFGKLGAAFAKLFREAPDQQVQDDLRCLKQVLETGQITVSDATWRRGMHPAQPPAPDER